MSTLQNGQVKERAQLSRLESDKADLNPGSPAAVFLLNNHPIPPARSGIEDYGRERITGWDSRTFV